MAIHHTVIARFRLRVQNRGNLSSVITFFCVNVFSLILWIATLALLARNDDWVSLCVSLVMTEVLVFALLAMGTFALLAVAFLSLAVASLA